MLETIPLEHIPSSHTVHAALFRNVANAEFLQSQLLGRNPDFEYAFIDATTVASRFHLLSAVYKAVSIEAAGSMKTPNVHSEIVCSLSSNNNVRGEELLVCSYWLCLLLVLIPSSSLCTMYWGSTMRASSTSHHWKFANHHADLRGIQEVWYSALDQRHRGGQGPYFEG